MTSRVACHWRSLFRGVVLLSVVAGLAASPVRGGDAAEKQAKLNGGYYLLHELSDDEAHVPLLMLVKHTPAEISALADAMSKVAKKNLAALDRFQDGDAAIRFDQNPLPAIENDVRASIKADKQHELLFGTSDSEFVRNFIVAQIEAATYAMHLNKVLAEQETDPARAKTLQQLSSEWMAARAHAWRLLSNY